MNFIKRIFNHRKENIIFLHLPKAGGTTLRHIFYEQYSYLKPHEIYTINRTKETPEFLNLKQEDRDNIKLLLGHFSFGLHEYLNKGNQFKYVTMLREPKSRVVSAYNYTQSLQNHELHKLTSSKSLATYLSTPNLGWLENGQTKFIAGVKDFNLECTEKVYNQAIKKLEQHFIAVGILERFDESIKNFKTYLNWTKTSYQIKNSTNQEKKALSEEDERALSDKNRFDSRLYDYVNKRLTLELENQKR